MSLESERRSIGTSNEKTRQAIGKQITNDLNRLVRPTTTKKQLAELAKRGALPAKAGSSVYTAPAAVGGGGIASPLTETDYSKREYWDSGLLSSDGLFSMPAIKKLVLTDAAGAEAVINLAEPTPAAST